jgi:hypothetical protein
MTHTRLSSSRSPPFLGEVGTMRLLPVLMLFVAGCSSLAPLPGAVNDAGGSAIASAKKGLVVKVATASKQPIQIKVGGVGAFAVLAKNKSAALNGIIVSVNVGDLPMSGVLCQTSANGQCAAPPNSSILQVNIAHNQALTFAVFLTPTDKISKGTVKVQFLKGKTVIASGHVTVTTKT